ncbi:hypothetical protein ABK040_014408 [Willaertia magna]
MSEQYSDFYSLPVVIVKGVYCFLWHTLDNYYGTEKQSTGNIKTWIKRRLNANIFEIKGAALKYLKSIDKNRIEKLFYIADNTRQLNCIGVNDFIYFKESVQRNRGSWTIDIPNSSELELEYFGEPQLEDNEIEESIGGLEGQEDQLLEDNLSDTNLNNIDLHEEIEEYCNERNKGNIEIEDWIKDLFENREMEESNEELEEWEESELDENEENEENEEMNIEY